MIIYTSGTTGKPEAEIQAQYSLHRLKACLGEPIEVLRTPAGQIEVGGLVATPERKEDLRAALEGVPFLKIRIRTVGEALQQHSSSPQDLTNSSPMKEDSSAHQTVTVPFSRLPIQDRLEQILREPPEGFSPGDERDSKEAANLNAKVTACLSHSGGQRDFVAGKRPDAKGHRRSAD
ncbi:MAG: hypothetical protein L0338_19800 [Acidobacteria bacterium]|nr:hypothetical protein [Acidobacteriota bacterium]